MKGSKAIPATVQRFLAKRAARYPAIKRMILYGSRARGDAKTRSDFDLAVIAPRMPAAAWSRFALEVEEEIPTLCGVDILLLNKQTSRPLRTRIKAEGVTIYECAA